MAKVLLGSREKTEKKRIGKKAIPNVMKIRPAIDIY
jgi:hypothetical protein